MPLLGQRLFDLPAANALVPRLTEIFRKARAELDSARALAARLESLGHPLSPESKLSVETGAPPEVRDSQRELISLGESLAAAMQEVSEMGAEVKAPDGLVDFRSRLEGRLVYLCWHFPETSITTWHELDGGFAGRRPVTDPEAFEGDLLQ